MRGGKRQGAGRNFQGWTGVSKGVGTSVKSYPTPLADKLDALKAQGANIQDIIKALDYLNNQNTETDLEWKAKFEQAERENRRLFEKARKENERLKQKLEDADKYIEQLKQRPFSEKRATKRQPVTINR